MSDVTWLPIPWAPDYEVSSDGQLRRLDRHCTRTDGKPYFLRGKDLALNLVKGYPATLITVDGTRINVKIHRVMCEAFYGPCPPGHEVRHLNGIKTDNRIENLRWGTGSENIRDTIRHGTHIYASRTHCDRGHEYTPENTRLDKGANGARRCRACGRQWRREYVARKRRAA